MLNVFLFTLTGEEQDVTAPNANYSLRRNINLTCLKSLVSIVFYKTNLANCDRQKIKKFATLYVVVMSMS